MKAARRVSDKEDGHRKEGGKGGLKDALRDRLLQQDLQPGLLVDGIELLLSRSAFFSLEIILDATEFGVGFGDLGGGGRDGSCRRDEK